MTAVDTTAMFTTRHVIDRTGVPLRNLHYWAEWGIIEPASAVTGSGHRWAWDADEIRVIRVVDRLRSIAKSGYPIVEFMDGPWHLIRSLVREHTAGWLLVAGDGRVGVTTDPVQLYRWQQSAAVTVIVDLAGVA